MNATKSSLAISHNNAELQTNVSESDSVSIISDNVRSDWKSLTRMGMQAHACARMHRHTHTFV
jgi:hypothetical protein